MVSQFAKKHIDIFKKTRNVKANNPNCKKSAKKNDRFCDKISEIGCFEDCDQSMSKTISEQKSSTNICNLSNNNTEVYMVRPNLMAKSLHNELFLDERCAKDY